MARVHFVKKAKVPLEVTSIINPQKHTTIEDSTSKTKGAKIIGFKKGLTLFVITDDKISEYGFLYNITKIFNDYGINMVLIRNTRDSLHIVVESNNKNLQKVLGELKNKKHVIKRSQVSMVTLIGELNWKMVNDFNEILLKTCSSSELGAFPYSDCVRLEAIIKGCEIKEVVCALHKKFIK